MKKQVILLSALFLLCNVASVQPSEARKAGGKQDAVATDGGTADCRKAGGKQTDAISGDTADCRKAGGKQTDATSTDGDTAECRKAGGRQTDATSDDSAECRKAGGKPTEATSDDNDTSKKGSKRKHKTTFAEPPDTLQMDNAALRVDLLTAANNARNINMQFNIPTVPTMQTLPVTPVVQPVVEPVQVNITPIQPVVIPTTAPRPTLPTPSFTMIR